jgi:2-oxoisovalerate dehydrogenase E1 component
MELFNLLRRFQLLPCDYVSPYYRDESILLGLGFKPYTLMLQLLAKGDNILPEKRIIIRD